MFLPPPSREAASESKDDAPETEEKHAKHNIQHEFDARLLCRQSRFFEFRRMVKYRQRFPGAIAIRDCLRLLSIFVVLGLLKRLGVSSEITLIDGITVTKPHLIRCMRL
jgi:hypothetical protein